MSESFTHERERLAVLALWLIRGISGRAIARARENLGSVREALRLPRDDLAAILGLRESGRRQLERAPEDLLGWAGERLAKVSERGGQIALRGEASYPEGLSCLEDPPEVVFYRGERIWEGGALPAEGARTAPLEGEGQARGPHGPAGAVAIVGARKADPASVRLAHRMGHRVAKARRLVVSGGAYGVDAAAHRGALDAGGQTLAVLGSGVLLPLPVRNRRLFASILEGGGALLSELPPEAGARPEHFPRRNRLVAALAEAVVVVRAAEGSGSLHTARAAFRLGRKVYAVPDPRGGAANAGVERLLGEGASPVRDPEELIAALDGDAVEGAASSIDEALRRRLEGPPVSIAELAAESGLPMAEISKRLARWCAAGEVVSRGPGRFGRREGAMR